MKNEVAVFMLKEIDAKFATRKKRIDQVLAWKLDQVRRTVESGADLTGTEEAILDFNYTRFTDPNRLKWGHVVRPS